MPNNKIKTLKVGILGEPNTGKSTLFNTLMNKKYSIVTRKAQTTVQKNSAVLAKKNKQIIFTDTPGVITYKKNINSYHRKHCFIQGSLPNKKVKRKKFFY